jgi:hypothetical protein
MGNMRLISREAGRSFALMAALGICSTGRSAAPRKSSLDADAREGMRRIAASYEKFTGRLEQAAADKP